MANLRFMRSRSAASRLVSRTAELAHRLIFLGADDYTPKAFIPGSAELIRLLDQTCQMYSAKVQLRARGVDASLSVSPDLDASSDSALLEVLLANKCSLVYCTARNCWYVYSSHTPESGGLGMLSSSIDPREALRSAFAVSPVPAGIAR